MNIDDLLDRSAPPLVARDADLAGELLVLLGDAEDTVRPRRRFRVALAALAGAGALGAGTTGAMAAGWVPGPAWVPWTTEAGAQCEMEFEVSPAGPDGEPLSRHYTQAEKNEAVRVSTEFLQSYDYEAIDEEAAVEAWQTEEDRIIASEPDPEERQPRLKDEDLRLIAVGAVVWADLTDHLRSRGVPTELVVSSQSWACGQ